MSELGAYGRTILRRIFKEYDGKASIGLIWPKKGTNGWFFVNTVMGPRVP